MRDALHIYGQAWPHEMAFIVGDTESLRRLRDAIDVALKDELAGASFYTQDGEGYDVAIVDASKADTEEMHLPYTDMEGIGLIRGVGKTSVDIIGIDRFRALLQKLRSNPAI